MASRTILRNLPSRPLARSLAQTSSLSRKSILQAPSFSTSTPRLQDALPVRKPAGAVRGSIFGFLAGGLGAGIAVYYYILEEYRVSNQLLTEDIFALQAAVQRIEGYVRTLEEELSKKK